MFLVLNTATIVDVYASLHTDGEDQHVGFVDFETDTKRVRTVELVGIAVIFLRST